MEEELDQVMFYSSGVSVYGDVIKVPHLGKNVVVEEKLPSKSDEVRRVIEYFRGDLKAAVYGISNIYQRPKIARIARDESQTAKEIIGQPIGRRLTNGQYDIVSKSRPLVYQFMFDGSWVEVCRLYTYPSKRLVFASGMSGDGGNTLSFIRSRLYGWATNKLREVKIERS